LSFLMNNYKLNKLKEISWMSQGLDTAKQFRNIHQIPLMRYKGGISDFIYKDYFYAEGELFKINENFGTNKVNEPELLKIAADSLLEFKKLNGYLTKKNRIFPDSLNIYTQPAIQFTKEQLAIIEDLTKGLNYDQTFLVARDFAFQKDYKKARLLCDYILNEFPNYADARTLKGRTLAWEGKYKTAEVQLLNVLKRTPFYDDNYLALLDLYWWSKQDIKAVDIAKKAEEHEIKNPDIPFKLAQAYQRMNNLSDANKVMDSILKLDPKNVTYLTFKNSLKQ
ncbi:MAG: sulfatase, partial [Lutibacter sp.]|nr:sulfatase [Lutibacter sp.]